MRSDNITTDPQLSRIFDRRQKFETIIAGSQRRIRLGATSYLSSVGISARSPSRRPCFRPGKQIRNGAGRRGRRKGGKRLEKVFPGCGREKSSHRSIHIRTVARASVSVYLHICHDLNWDNPPGFIPKSINTYYPLIENRTRVFPYVSLRPARHLVPPGPKARIILRLPQM